MIYNAFIDKNTINYAYYDKQSGKVLRDSVDYKPITGELVNYPTKYRDIHGRFLKVTEYKDIKEYKSKTYSTALYGQIDPIYQFLANRFKDDSTIEMASDAEVYSFDIEVYTESKFPRPNNPMYMVNAITLHNMKDNIFYTWGLKDYTPKKKNHLYRNCVDELTLIECFLNFIEKKVNIMTGFNIDYFDIPYLVNRCRVLQHNSVVIRDYLQKYVVKYKGGYKIKHMQLLDYQVIYKKFGKKLERYSLDFICKAELGKGKIEYDGKLYELYNKDHDTYIDYNLMDVQLIYELEMKCKNFNKILKITNMCRCLPSDYTSPIKTWDSRLYWYLIRNDVLVPPPRPFNEKEIEEIESNWNFSFTDDDDDDDDDDDGILGGFVSDPIKGMHEWVTCRDVTSSYPHQIMEFNISPDRKITQLSPNLKKIRDYFIKKYPDLPKRIEHLASLPDEELQVVKKILVKENCTMTPNLQFYDVRTKGIFNTIVEHMFGERNIAKNKASEYHNLLEDIRKIKEKELENGRRR